MLSVTVACIPFLLAGCTLGFPSGALLDLEERTDLKLTRQQADLFGVGWMKHRNIMCACFLELISGIYQDYRKECWTTDSSTQKLCTKLTWHVVNCTWATCNWRLHKLAHPLRNAQNRVRSLTASKRGSLLDHNYLSLFR